MPRSTFANVPFSLAHLSELEVAPASLIEFAARAGFASVGLRIAPASPGGIVYPLRTAAEQAEVRRQMTATGVSVLYVEMINLNEQTRAADYAPMLEIGAGLGASRVAVSGESANFEAVAAAMAAICDLAKPYGMAVDIEFMPYRPVATLSDALDVVRRTGRPNAHVLLDALHFYRSRSTMAALGDMRRSELGTFQICDAPAAAPSTSDALIAEARTRRLLPGQGGLDLDAIIDALPADVPFGIEVPLRSQHPELSPAERLARLVAETRKFLK